MRMGLRLAALRAAVAPLLMVSSLKLKRRRSILNHSDVTTVLRDGVVMAHINDFLYYNLPSRAMPNLILLWAVLL